MPSLIISSELFCKSLCCTVIGDSASSSDLGSAVESSITACTLTVLASMLSGICRSFPSTVQLCTVRTSAATASAFWAQPVHCCDPHAIEPWFAPMFGEREAQGAQMAAVRGGGAREIKAMQKSPTPRTLAKMA
eukprot:CAMPEP_0195099158 /NCGR_PEP_ID=MMETSP0448-20130528/58109_1 /TAXON_ID=66468 /ORGANISM="Heterocapsa triquestra, Strain CCMP 448" /LENGTH=133 /DNA_ID=CAMNT_0040133993 /DNA_START=79 /DNA_END=477 /DNA_ORIENTATION=+